LTAIFQRQLDETARVKTASRIRVCPPFAGGVSRNPVWRQIERPGSGEPAADPEVDSPALPAGRPNDRLFDELDLATIAARAAWRGWQDGYAAADRDHQDRGHALLAEIAGQLERFTASIELPIPAIRAQLVALLDGILGHLEAPAVAPERVQRLRAAIDNCLQTLATPGPLQLVLHPDDQALLDAFADGDGATAIGGSEALTVRADPALAPGTVRLSWPGGGIEQLAAARQRELHAILESLAPPAGTGNLPGEQP